MSNKSFRLQILPVPLILAVFLSCEQAENLTSERLVFSVETSDPAMGSYNAARDEYNISTEGGAFFSSIEGGLPPDSAFVPQQLNIKINLPGGLIESLLRATRYLPSAARVLSRAAPNISQTSPDSPMRKVLIDSGILQAPARTRWRSAAGTNCWLIFNSNLFIFYRGRPERTSDEKYRKSRSTAENFQIGL